MDNTKTDMGEVAKRTIAEREAGADAGESGADELRKRLGTPIAADEARREYARVDMQEAQLLLLREQMLGQLNQVDQQLAGCRCMRAELACRLTAPGEEASE